MIKPEDNYAEWVDEMYLANTPLREKQIKDVLTQFSRKSKEAKAIADALVDKKEFEKPLLLGYLHFTHLGSQKPDTLSHYKFPRLTVGFKHKRLPIIVAVSLAQPELDTAVPIEETKNSLGVVQALSYTHTLSKMTAAEKKALRDQIIEGVRSYRPISKPSSLAKEKDIVWLSDYLAEEKDFSLVGFAANLPYLNVDPKFGDTKNFWIHAWGTPQLLFSHKRLPAIMIAGPSVRLDENVLGDKSMTGFTG